MLDVAVVGGGPTGSRLAASVAAGGYQTAVFEKRATPGGKLCCTGIVSRDCVKRFEIPAEIVFREVSSAIIFSPSGDHLRLSRPETQAYVVDRPALDTELAERAKRAGAGYHFSSEIVEVAARPDKVTMKTAVGETIESKAVVIATGFGGSLRPKLGLGRPTVYAAGAQAQVKLYGTEQIEIYLGQRIAPGYFAWLVPTGEGRGLAGLLARSTPAAYLKNWAKELVEKGKLRSAEFDIAAGGIPMKPLARTYRDRVVVVGDAAGQVKPTTGGGIYFGLLCADMAAETLLQALKADDLSARRLAEYERRWRHELGPELRREYLARRFYDRLSDGQIERLFRALKSGAAERLLQSPDLSFDYHGNLLLKALRIGAAQMARRWLR